jgi:hypothetical protein
MFWDKSFVCVFSWIQKFWISICLVRLLTLASFSIMLIVEFASMHRVEGLDCLKPSSAKNCRIQIMSLPVLTVAYNSASGVDRAMACCFLHDQWKHQ